MELDFAAGRLGAGRATFRRALELFRELDDHWVISAVQYHQGMALHRAGLFPEALEVYRSALSEGRIGLTNTVQYALANLGHISLVIGDLDGAAAYFSSAHAVACELGAEASVLALLGQGHLARLRDDPVEAARCYDAALSRMSASETPDWVATALIGLGQLAHDQGDIDTALRRQREALRRTTSGGQPTYPPAAAALEVLAAVAASRHLLRAAGRLLGTAAAWRQSSSWPASPLELRNSERVTTLLSDCAQAVITD